MSGTYLFILFYDNFAHYRWVMPSLEKKTNTYSYFVYELVYRINDRLCHHHHHQQQYRRHSNDIRTSTKIRPPLMHNAQCLHKCCWIKYDRYEYLYRQYNILRTNWIFLKWVTHKHIKPLPIVLWEHKMGDLWRSRQKNVLQLSGRDIYSFISKTIGKLGGHFLNWPPFIFRIMIYINTA